MIRRLLAVLGVALLLAVRPAAASEVTLHAVAAAGPYFKRGSPLAIRVTARNDGPAREGVAAIDPPGPDLYVIPHLRVRQPVYLPTGSLQEFSLLYPNTDNFYYNGSQTWKLPVRLEDGGGDELARDRLELREIAADDALVLALTPQKSGFDFLKALRPHSQKGHPTDVYVAYPDPRTLPDHWAGYFSASLVILHHPGGMGLQPVQERALLEWVASGGSAVVIPNGDPAELNALALGAAVPAEVAGAATLRAPPGAFAAADLPLIRAGPIHGQVLWRCNGAPVLLAAHHGLGLIFQWMVDPRALRDAAARHWWRLILSRAAASARQDPVVNYQEMLAGSLQTTPPSTGVLALFLLLYFLMAGPLNFVVLRRRDALLWSFATVPLMAVLFSGAIYLVNCYAKGSRTIVRSVSLAQTVSGSRDAQVRTIFSLFAPRRTAYDVTLGGDAVLFGELERTPGSLTTDLADGFRLRGLPMQMWTMRRFVGMSVCALGGRLRADLRVAGSPGGPLTVVGRIASPRPLERCVVYQDGRVTPPFDVAAGVQSVALRFDLPRAPRALQDRLCSLWIAPDGTPLDDSRALIARSVVAMLATTRSTGPVLLGWTPALEPLEVSDRRAGSRQATLLMVRPDDLEGRP